MIDIILRIRGDSHDKFILNNETSSVDLLFHFYFRDLGLVLIELF